jgi:hypothetical protein
MDLLDALYGILSTASGFVLGTVLTWIISYYLGKRTLPKLLKSVSNNPEVVEAIQTIMKKANSNRDS